MKYVVKMNEVVSRLLTAVGAVLVVLLMLGISAAAISRYFFNRPIASMTELSAYSLLFITFLGAPLLASEDGHIAVDVVPNSLRPKGREIMNAVMNFLSCAITLAIAWFALNTTLHSSANHEVTADILKVPMDFMFGLICVGSFFMALGFFTNGIRKLRELPNIK